MTPDIQREPIPRDESHSLVNALTALKSQLLDTAQTCQLLDRSAQLQGGAPAYSDLLQHAADAQHLAHGVIQLTADFTGSPHSTTHAGPTVLTHLATATSMSSLAAAHFAESAEHALSLPRPSNPAVRRYLETRMLVDHSSARAFLRRASESLRDAAKELEDPLNVHRNRPFPKPAWRQSPEPPQPAPNPSRR
ncbi:hypothetical protein [Streptomyces sp. NBC_00483]|uniref:hypothetical protein n=1 Tax=Streptomyces sp. NBC_00483 TaxID=2975756 RepID=UPI002E191410